MLDQAADGNPLERGDPVDAALAAEFADGLLRHHAAVADHHHLRQAEALAHALHGGQEGQAVGGMALDHRDNDRAAAHIGQKPVVDMQRDATAVVAVAATHQGAGATFEPTRRQAVLQRDRNLGEVTRGDPLLDGVLALEQPAHGGTKAVFIGVGHAQLPEQGGALPAARDGELGVEVGDASSDHGQHEVTSARPRRPGRRARRRRAGGFGE